MEAKVGPHNAENGEGYIAEEFVRQTDGHLHQRDEQTRFTHQPGDDKKHAHLLKQQQHQIKLVHTQEPHLLKTRNIH